MINDLKYKMISTNNNELNGTIPESSPAYQFCKKISEINETNESGWTPIYRAIISNNLDALKDLLKYGGNPNLPNNLGESPIYLCVDMDNLEALNILLNNSNQKANCNIQKRNGDTALHLSFKKSKFNFSNILLENGADPNISNKLYSQTPTHLAIINKCDEKILEKLKNNNADIYNFKDKYDKTAYDYAIESDDKNYIKSLQKVFGEKIKRKLLYNSLSDDNKINNINKSSNNIECNDKNNNSKLSKSLEEHIQDALTNPNIKEILKSNMDSNNKKVKEIILSEINKINVSEKSSNNKYSTPKENFNFLNINSNLNSNSNTVSSFLINKSRGDNKIISSSLERKDYNNLNDSNPLEMMNQIIISKDSLNQSNSNNNSIENKKTINYVGKNNKLIISDSLEFKNAKTTKINSNNLENSQKNEEINNFEFEDKKNISYNNLNKNKEKIIPKLNLSNLTNNNKNSRNNQNEINQNPHFESSTNPNTSRGSGSAYLTNFQINNIMSSLKNNDNNSNYIYLTEQNESNNRINIKMNGVPYPNKPKNSNTNYKMNQNKYILTEEEFDNNDNIINKNKTQTQNNKVFSKKIVKLEDNITPTIVDISKLRDWLISCDLISYYNLLKNNSSFDIDKYINNLKDNKKVTFKDIENLGIRKPGHIFRFLIKLQIDANIIDFDIHSKIINKFNSNVLTTPGLTLSNNEIKCCGLTLTLGNKDFNNTNTSNSYNDIFHFLKYLGLMKFKENFLHNGFDQVDYIILQLFSEYKFDKVILKEFLHIYDENDKKTVINVLYEEKKKIAKELGIQIEGGEKEEILNTQVRDDYDNEKCYII